MIVDYIQVDLGDIDFIEFVLGDDFRGVEDDRLLVYIETMDMVAKIKNGDYIFTMNGYLRIYEECDFKIGIMSLAKMKKCLNREVM